MEFLDKATLQIRDAKRDKSIFLYTVIILIPCLLVMLFAFIAAYIPVDFKLQDDEISVLKIGYFCSYAPKNINPHPYDFQFG